jgi:hypothetical protein
LGAKIHIIKGLVVNKLILNVKKPLNNLNDSQLECSEAPSSPKIFFLPSNKI